MRKMRLLSQLEGVDAVVLANYDRNFAYYSGLDGAFGGAVCVVTRDDVRVVVSKLDGGAAEDIHSETYSTGVEKKEILSKLLKGKTIGINPSKLYSNTRDELASYATLKDVSQELANVRAIKESREIKAITAATELTREAIRSAKESLKKGVSEKAIAHIIDTYFINHDAEPAFPTIVAFDANASTPHHETSDALLTDVALIDCGARLRGYCGDLTETYSLTGKWQDEIDVIRKAQHAGFEALFPGVIAKDVDAVARKIIDSTKLKGSFVHSLGHSLGLEVHDGLSLSANSETKIEEDMVFTVEPGAYIQGKFGARLEMDVVVTKKGAREL